MKFAQITSLLVAALSVGACGIFGSGDKLTPDEFEVVSRAPLVVPPESEMRPPRPGEAQAQLINPAQRAFEALFPGQTFKDATPISDAEAALLRGVGRGDPNIRSQVAQKNDKVVPKTLLLADMLAAEDRLYRPDLVTIQRVSSEPAPLD